MIFVTVGAQMPFDRLVRAVDEWAHSRGRTDVVAQIGTTPFKPQSIRCVEFLKPDEFRDLVSQCTVLVAHAGMGSILTALEHGKPLLVMPRRGDLMETRNDHQVATAQRFEALGRLAVAHDEAQVAPKLDALASLRPTERIGPHASDQLIEALRAFIAGNPPVTRR